VRIIAGTNRGLRLQGPGSSGRVGFRPTADRVRESLFNILQGMDAPLEGARILDVFAGTGALGLEAASRGATEVTFVENARASLKVLHRNLELCKVTAQVITRDATRLGPGLAHDLIFLDPPYGKGLGEQAITKLMAGGWIAKDALIVWEEAAVITPPEGLRVVDMRSYGQTQISFLTAH